ncbi:MAG: LLM class flavin-dependent oxidoreductase [Dehalococcoidia bacterium]|nr:LLM class flavin-dependent oxidoreductase [Dehalococcoidia bacterium]MCB9484514.1 LLM class flavin-dependent oxidoreductase [Thermoflexaceae bacterium]
MRAGVHFNFQNYSDWARFESHGAGPQAVTDQQVYEEDLYLASLVEPLGFDSYWAIDHHFGPYIMTGGAIQHLTFMAGQTKRIDFGTMVVVLPWYDPVVIAEQISVLDNLLQGRCLTLGLGRGAAKREFDAYRVPMDESRDRFAESLQVVRKALTQEWFSHEGDFYTIPETTIRPRPRNPQALVDSMRVAWTSPQTLPITANAGLGMLMTNQKSWEEYRQDVREFNAVRAGKGWSPTQPTVVVHVSCFDTEAEAWAVMRRHTIEAQDSILRHYGWKDEQRLRQTKGYEQYAKFSQLANEKSIEEIGERSALPQAWGTPDQVLEKLKHIQQMTSAEELILNFRFGGMPAGTAERSMRLFASNVLDGLHAVEALLHPDMAGAAGG